jgi:CheY-like chemotaxis protein
MGGTIRLDSELDHGSTFRFDFLARLPEPAVEAEAAFQDAETMSSRQDPPRPGLDILVVEDNPVNQRLTQAILAKAGHRVTIAASGQQALDQIARRRFDLALMDLQMPDLNGLDTAARIREREDGSGRHLPIIALTANALHGDRERCLTAGMDDYLSKPFTRTELLQKLAQVQAARTATTMGTTDHTAAAYPHISA